MALSKRCRYCRNKLEGVKPGALFCNRACFQLERKRKRELMRFQVMPGIVRVCACGKSYKPTNSNHIHCFERCPVVLKALRDALELM